MKRRYLSLLTPACFASRRGCPAQLAAFSRRQCASSISHTSFRNLHTAAAPDALPLSRNVAEPLCPRPLHPSSPPTHPNQSCTDTLLPVPTNAAPADQWYTLGLDINTQSIGYVLLSPFLHTVRRGLISLSHLPTSSTPAARLRLVTEQLSAIVASLPPHAQLHTAVESYLLSFSAARFQTRNLFQLAAFNNLVQCQLWHLTGQRDWPAVVNVNRARSRFGLKGEVKEGKGGRRVSDVKGVVWRWVDERLKRERDSAAAAAAGSEAVSGAGEAELEWRRKRDGSVHATMYDISDAYLIALTAAMDRQQQQNTVTVVDDATARGSGNGETDDTVHEETDNVSVSKKGRVRKVRQARTVVVTSTGLSDISVPATKGRRRRIAAGE